MPEACGAMEGKGSIMVNTWRTDLWKALPPAPFQIEALPEGLYAVWIAQGGRVEAQLWRLALQGEEMSMRGARHFRHPLRRGGLRQARRGAILGGFQQTSRGVTLLANLGAGQSLAMVCFDYALGGVPGLWRGRGLDGHGDLRVAMLPAPAGCTPLRALLRDLGQITPDRLPKAVAPWLLA